METALIYLGPNELVVAMIAPELLKSCKHFPKYLTPCYLFLSQKLHKLVNIPQFVSLVL